MTTRLVEVTHDQRKCMREQMDQIQKALDAARNNINNLNRAELGGLEANGALLGQATAFV